jgi:hypothetical protein
MKLHRIIPIMLAMCSMVVLTACGDEVGSDQVALKYTAGAVEGRHFDKVLEPGATDFWNSNDKIHRLPLSQRSFVVRKVTDKNDKARPDVDGYITVPSEDNTLVDFEISTTWMLNTRANDIDGFEGGTLRKFFENLCRAYDCWSDEDGNIPDGFRKMLREKLYASLEAAFKDEARRFPGDDIVSNAEITVKGPDGSDVKVGTQNRLRDLAAKSFLSYLKKQAGGEFFCGPTFDRSLKVKAGDEKACPPIELVITSADYANSDLRASREGKEVASNQAAAQKTLSTPLKDPNYLAYLRIQAMEKCVQNAKAVCVFGSSAEAALAK